MASGVGTRRARNFWSVHEDTVLVATIIDNTAFLRGPANTRPRSRFWLHISFELKVRHGLARNKRQCRDRFNLLFWKAVRDHRSSRKDLKRLDRLLAQCLTILYIDKNNVIMLKDQTSSETGAGAAGTPAHNLLHTSDASAAAAAANAAANAAAAAAAAANAAAAAPGLTEDAHVIPPAQQSPLLHQQQLSPAASQASVVGSAGELTDASFDALTDLAAGLQQQVSSLTHRVEELCGMLAMERSRVDYLLSARMGLDSPINAYAPAGLDVPISSSSQYLAMNSPPYLAVASPYMRGGLHH